jgi:hypothetical protein
MLQLHELTLARSRKRCGPGGGDGVAVGIFPYIYQGSSGLALSLTCRQGEIVEDLSEEVKRTRVVVRHWRVYGSNYEMHANKRPIECEMLQPAESSSNGFKTEKTV